jgi:DnaJ-class molecular chaperone
MTKTPTLYCDDDTKRELPFTWEICHACSGHGKSSAYLGAYTRDEMEEQGSEFIEDYCAGHYDRTCDNCGGSGKVKVADESRMSKADRKAYREQCDADHEIRALERAERLFEGGWREEGWFGR